jgi:hypothetical protein
LGDELNAKFRVQGQTDCKNGGNPGLVGVGGVPDSQNAIAPLTPELNSPVDVRERRTSLLDEETAYLCEFHIPFVFAREQMKSVVFFDLGDLFAECRLGDVQSVGSAREVQFLGQDIDCV